MKYHKNMEELVTVHPDFIGFIFHEASPRNSTEVPTVKIPNTIQKTGVVVDKSFGFILEKIVAYQLNVIQLHGKESPEYCHKLKNLLAIKGLKIIKAFNIHAHFDFNVLKEYEPYCDYFLFDAFGKNAGGNGIPFKWQLLAHYHGTIPFLLSGGIDETMVNEIKKLDHPQFIGVDINSGFETKPGLKNMDKIKQFKAQL